MMTKHGTRLLKWCPSCDAVFSVIPSRAVAQFCSIRCANKNKNPVGPNKGRVFSVEHRAKLSKAHVGVRHPNWRGGIGRSARKLAMQRHEYVSWRKAVFVRGNYTCQECGVRGCALNADHIKPWALYPELRYDLNNGRTLCVPCHLKMPTHGRKITL